MRKIRKKHIKRKKRIIHEILGNNWSYKYDGCLSKGKIHCSCGLCASKTRNKKYKRRHLKRNYSPNINFKHSDLKKIISMKQSDNDEIEY